MSWKLSGILLNIDFFYNTDNGTASRYWVSQFPIILAFTGRCRYWVSILALEYRAGLANADNQYWDPDIRWYQRILVSIITTSGDLATARGPHHLFNLCEDPRVRVRGARSSSTNLLQNVSRAALLGVVFWGGWLHGGGSGSSSTPRGEVTVTVHHFPKAVDFLHIMVWWVIFWKFSGIFGVVFVRPRVVTLASSSEHTVQPAAAIWIDCKRAETEVKPNVPGGFWLWLSIEHDSRGWCWGKSLGRTRMTTDTVEVL